VPVPDGARVDPLEAAAEILSTRYPGADSLLLAGSITRGEATATSDLDLVVLFPKLPRSFRESFVHRGWPVEVFAHDDETIEYFFLEQDLKSGVGSMLWMVHDGIPVPRTTALNGRIKAHADELLAAGPPSWSAAETDYSRYTITGQLDDLVAPRNDGEYRAIVAQLFHLLANHYLRSRRQWGAHSKTLPRRLARVDAALAARFDAAFDAAFLGEPATLFAVADEILAPEGGRLFDGYRSESDAGWRRTPPK
jgi:hypothetical protein